MRDELLKQTKRVVIKIGSSLVASRETGLSAERIDRLAGEIAEVRAQGREVLVVSSGAVVSGIKKLGLLSIHNYEFRKCGEDAKVSPLEMNTLTRCCGRIC